MDTLPQRAVLFADLRGSMALYGAIGNVIAAQWVSRTVGALGAEVGLCEGRLVKTLGDGLMAVFPGCEQAVQAAAQMQLAVCRDELRLSRMNAEVAQRMGEQRLQLQVAVAYGEVVELEADCFGDAVNLAARLLDHAGDSETLVTAEVLGRIPNDLAERFRSLDEVQVRGRPEPVEVHVLGGRATDTAATMIGQPEGPASPQAIRLRTAQTARDFAVADLPLTLGRGAGAHVHLDDARVSRSHARVEWHGGTLQLVDLSFNGTYVRFTNDDEVVSLRRGSCTLHGSGDIGLGGSPDDPGAPVLHFEVIRAAPGSGA